MQCSMIPIRFYIILFLLSIAVRAERITTFTTAKTIYDIEFVDNGIWVGTSGGLFYHDLITGNSQSRSVMNSFPDPVITALVHDKKGNLWVASEDGYLLFLQTATGKEYINNAYVTADWHISDLALIGKYLVIASSRGVSLFDTEKRVVVKNAGRINKFPSSQINTIAIHDNRLYVGGESGVAWLKVTNDKIASLNFYDPMIWEVDTSMDEPVRCFLTLDDTLTPFSGPAAFYLNTLFTVDSAGGVVVHTDSAYTIPFTATITTMKTDPAGHRCIFGTEEDFLFYQDPTGDRQIMFEAPKWPTFTSVNRVYIDRTRLLWVLPYGLQAGRDRYNPPWWLGINTFDGITWTNYSQTVNWQMGHLALSTEGYFIVETRDGRIWFGVKGGSIKCFDRNKNEWTHYCVFGKAEGNGAFCKAEGRCPENDWGLSAAMAEDSSGNLWISSWNNFNGCLLCYRPDPEESDSLTLDGKRLYRRFPPNGSEGIIVNITAIAVDSSQNVIYGTENGIVTVARYEGDKDPVSDSGNFKIRKTFSELQKIHKMVVLPDGSTLILAVSGVHRFDPETMTMKILDDFDRNVTTLSLENGDIYWYAIAGEGIVKYDLLKNEKTRYNHSQGLVSDDVNDIFVDKANGFVWVGTERGLSRLSLGYTARSSTTEEDLIFPNPFHKRRHSIMHFQNIPRDAKLQIYALNGNLVATPKFIREGDSGAYYQWQPPSDIAPGTYFYVIISPLIKKTGKIMITP